MRLLPILIICLFVFAVPVSAAPQILTSSLPSSVIAGQEFEVSVSASDLIPTANYYVKALGGENFTEVDTKSGESWFQQNSAWSNMPPFTSNTESSASGVFKARFDIGTQGGSKQFKVRIRKTDADSNYDSPVVYISVVAATPSPTASPKSPVTLAPTAMPIPSPAPTPTKIPIPLSTKTPIVTPTPQILGESNLDLASPSVISTESAEKIPEKKFPFIALGIILLGLVFIGTSCYMAFFRKVKTFEPKTLI